MNNEVNKYIEALINSVGDKISCYFERNKDDMFLVNEHFVNRLKNKKFIDFQEYYIKNLNNSNLNFREFRHKYSLQGIDRFFLQKLEDNKKEIIQFIKSDNLSDLYYRYFANIKIKNKESVSVKNLGSFFTKLVHTFNSTKYTPLDIPMKNYFGLSKENYFISFIIVSDAYMRWLEEDSNEKRIKLIKYHICNEGPKFNIDKITDMKILNIIFWSVADFKKKKTINY